MLSKAYSITIRDANQCIITFSDSVGKPAILGLTIQSSNVSCFGGNNGILQINPTGGISPYRFSLDSVNFDTASKRINLAPATYTIITKDSFGCTAKNTQTISQPTAIAHTIVVNNVSCNNGSDGKITLNVSGGVPPYTYQLDSFMYPTNVFDNLKPGIRNMVVVDQNGCFKAISQNILQPPPISGTIAKTIPTCHSGADATLTVMASNGVPPYAYNLDSGTYQTSNLFSGLAAKNYVVGIKDSNNCLNYLSSSISNPPPIIGVVTQTSPTCFNRADGKLTITASNGKLPYSFNLDSGTYQSSNLFSGLVAKNYVVGIKDSNSCLAYVNTSISNPPKIIAGGITGPNIVAQSSINTYSVFQQNSLNYKWLLSKGTITGGLNTSAVNIRWDSIGTDTLKALVYQDSTCGDTALMQIAIGGVGLADVAQLMGLTVFPNPTQSLLNITLSRLPAEHYLYVYDLQGKVKLQQEIQYNQQLDIQDLPSGMYFLVVGEWKGKIVKQ